MGIGERQWQVGRSKIFLRNGAHATLEEHRTRIIIAQSIRIQTVICNFQVKYFLSLLLFINFVIL